MILKHYGIDISKQLESILADELAREIDKEILRSISMDRASIIRRVLKKISKSNE